MPPQLLALSEGPDILIDRPILLFGRHQECDIQLGSRKVSRRHCCLAQVNDYVVVRDLGSTNGIRINGVRVHEGSLKPGDELTIGNQRFQLQWASQAPSPRQAPQSDESGPTISPSRAPADEDARLEAADSPVPLPEPANGRPAAPLVIPDSLKLQPLSGEQQRPAN